ncbi:CoB--CoM heterodisulfide reductase iron-sulfur subunit A family protein [bacterium]|nr:CoB--CoM heterodisulfide reductase iron-sulfur subunit A family protein [bacterium]
MHEPTFRRTCSSAGLNPYLFEMANIRDQCSWAHMNEPELATVKAGDLTEMAVAKARDLTPLERLPISINPDALVVGGGLAGMTAALSMAEAGHVVTLVEKEKVLGGHLRKLYYHLSGKNPQTLLSETIAKVQEHPTIQLYTYSEILAIDGYVGNFKTTFKSLETGDDIVVEHGAVIVATGAKEHQSKEYGAGESTRVVTQTEFEKMIHDNTFPRGRLRNVVMIQCVGSRETDKMYCSRVCCSDAMKNGLELKKVKPRANIYVCYRDIRTYGFKEKYYTDLRDKGTVFLRFEPDGKPKVELQMPDDANSKLTVTAFDPIMDREIVIAADLVVLSTGIDALEENATLAKMLKVPLNADGVFLEAHVKLRPVDFATEGVFVCGLAHGPKDIDESMTQAQAAASRALSFLTRESILAEGTIAEIDTDLCSGCGYCEKICAYAAIEVDPETEVAIVNDALCKGCGTCVASCRCGALDLRGFSNKQLHSVFEALDLTDQDEIRSEQ